MQTAKKASRAWLRALAAVKILDERPDAGLPDLIREMAQRRGGEIALQDAREALRYQDLSERVAQYAGWVVAQGFGKGEVICLLMPNCPDYVAVWLGVSQAGCVAALLNTNLAGDALAHSVKAAGAAHIIADESMLAQMAGVLARLPAGTQCWVNAETKYRRIEFGKIISPEVMESRRPHGRDTALLIYTSGTTGMPKAAKVTHRRLVEWSCWFAGMMDVQPSDRMYNCLPMYHSIGGVVAVGSMLVAGASVLIRERFSASQFWDDVTDGDCTIFQYIGELCRYLLQSPVHEREKQHRLRLCCGNGLQEQVWREFQARFEIPQILEFYAATEGNVSLYNCEGKPGAIGRVPAYLAPHFPVALIKCDTETGMPLRGADGLCIACETGESGEAIGKIGRGKAQFDGYTDMAASSAKILTNVFKAGDAWFRTGDLMRKDKAGYYYFIDRLGDTYRWKGENVSTTQVAAVIMACPGVTQAAVFGVAIPGHEGRAGMAAVTVAADFSLPVLQEFLAANLPDYARPVFIRFCDSLDMTATFKMMKALLQKENYMAATDPIWFYDRDEDKYVACDTQRRDLLSLGAIKRI